MASPIADLSYRHYDGPLEPPAYRWWAIARASMRLSLRKRGFWAWATLSGWFYILLLAIFFFVDTLSQNIPEGQKNPVLLQIVWKDQFLNAFSTAQLFYFILALLIGVGTIANDNRANALLVYLSKPCTRLDYIIGKWLGIFLPITLVTAVPTFLFYLYCVMTYRDYGFLTEDPRLIFKLLGMVTISGFVHASLSLGISSLFNQGRMAGATYAGLYFFTLFFTKAMQIISAVQQQNRTAVSPLVDKLYYASVDGLQIGLAKVVLGTDGSQLFPGMGGGNRRGGPPNPLPVPAPDWWLMFGAAGLVCGIALLVAWSRVKAVEVVG
ncbi:MAG: ABC transporter permease [Fimbriimonas sp.]